MTEQNRYDVILMDVQMPGMNGLEATAAIRKREDGGRPGADHCHDGPCDEGRPRAVSGGGMDGYLSKPINAHEMIALVESLAGWGGSGYGPTRSDQNP